MGNPAFCRYILQNGDFISDFIVSQACGIWHGAPSRETCRRSGIRGKLILWRAKFKVFFKSIASAQITENMRNPHQLRLAIYTHGFLIGS